MDTSEGSAEALRWAAREGELHGWSVTAVLAWGYLDQPHPGPGPAFDPAYGEEQAREVLTGAVVDAVGEQVARGIGLDAACERVAPALIERSERSALLVVGSRGLGGFRRLALGSVSQHVLHHAASPVAVVRSAPEQSTGDRERIVVAVDGSEPALRALRWALDEARLRGATLEAVHAWHVPAVGGYPYAGPAIDPDLLHTAAQQVLDAAVDEEAAVAPGVAVERTVRSGGAARVILDAAKGADLVVMGSRGLGGFKALLLGSVTTQVAHHAPCPLVVIPAGVDA